MAQNPSNISKSSLSCARAFLSKKKYGRSFANFLLFVKLSPNKTNEILDDFLHCMTQWTNQLIAEERIEDLFKCYDQACEILPGCESVLNNIGAQLFRLGYIEEAALYIRRSIQINPDYAAARHNLENVCSHLVERWHFRMLNDVRRNCAYKIAIRRAAQRGHRSIIDIGCGTGILSLFAMKAGMTEIYSCEKSRTMCDIANDVLLANKAQDKITLINKLSTDINIPEDIPERPSLLVTETFDAALFGENIIHTLHHALHNILPPVDEDNDEVCIHSLHHALCKILPLIDKGNEEIQPTVIPCGATVYVCPIECETILAKNRFLYTGLNHLDMEGLQIYCTTGSIEDPYTTENLSQIRGGYKLLSSPTVLTKINFSSIEELDIIVDGIQWDVNICITRSGRIDAIGLWFDLHLDEDISITTDPSNKNCWEQAIYPIVPSNFCQSCSALQNNFHVSSGHVAHLSFSLQENLLHFNSCHINSQDPDIEMEDIVIAQNSLEPILLERHEILKLNNLDINRLYSQAIQKVVIHGESDTISILDMCGELSLLTLQFINQGVSQAMLVARKELHDDILKIALQSKIDTNLLAIEESVNNVSGMYDVLICDLIEPCGTLKQQVLEDIALLRVSCQPRSGVVIPGRVTIHGMCIDSEDLLVDSCVISDEVTLGFKVAKYINDFKMTTHVDIDLVQLSHRKITAPFELLTFDLNEEITEQKPPSYLNLSNNIKIVSIETGHVTAVVYWFEFELYDGIHFATIDSVSPWKQAAVMLQHTEQPILTGQELTLNVTLENSCLDIKMEL